MKQSLLKEYPYKTELHAHTRPLSPCSEMRAERMIALCHEQGIDSVVLTNHFTPNLVAGYSREQTVARYMESFYEACACAERYGMTAILGLELRFTENCNDYLLYGIGEEDIAMAYDAIDGGLDRFYPLYKNDKNLIMQAHPFRDGMVPVNPESIDGVEAFNMHPGHNSRVALAAAYARKHGLLICGGTDFHHPPHAGSCFMRTKERMTDSYAVAQVIKNQDFVLDIGGNIVLP